MSAIAKWLVLPAIMFSGILMIVSCGGKESFASKNTTEFFVEDFNPPFIDVLWMIDDRTDLTYTSSIRNHLIGEAQTFFSRLDQMTDSDYRMAIINGDSSQAGTLLPHPYGVPLTKGLGTLPARVNAFTSVIGQIIGLSTSSTMSGLENARLALAGSFVPRAGVPLVMVFISDTDDHSVLPSGAGSNPISYYSSQYLNAVGNNANLLKVYSINYVAGGAHCASQSNIDQPSDYNNNFDKVSTQLGGQNVDLCGSFGNTIDLNGLKLSTPKTTFHLSKVPDVTTLTVNIYANGQSFPTPAFMFNTATNSIVFAAAPPAGTTIQVDYLSH